jgi:hypothetical protein
MIFMKRLLFLLPTLLLFFACDEVSTSNSTTTDPATVPPSGDQTTSTVKTPEATSADDEVELHGSPIDFTEFNQQIKTAQAAKEGWVNSPLEVMLKFTGSGMDSKVKSIRARQLGPGEIVEDVFVTVEEDGLMDDSVSGTMTMLSMKKEEGIWQVYKASRAWKCWKGRGHETYSGKPCT